MTYYSLNFLVNDKRLLSTQKQDIQKKVGLVCPIYAQTKKKLYYSRSSKVSNNFNLFTHKKEVGQLEEFFGNLGLSCITEFPLFINQNSFSTTRP